MTYLHRTEPSAPAFWVLSEVQLEVLVAKSQKLPSPKELTVEWALSAVARLGGYLSHRQNSNIGIQVLWRGFKKLHSLCLGWQLRENNI